MYYLGIDCGGTNLRVGLVTDEGDLTQKWKIPSPLKTNPQSLAEVVRGLVSEETFEAIGIGVPGPLDLEKGLILPSSNLGNKEPINLQSQFDSMSKKTYLDRDTVVALMGEAWKGAAVGVKNVVMLTLGTGVGGAIMVNGEIDRGESGKAGEIGHMILGLSGSFGRKAPLGTPDSESLSNSQDLAMDSSRDKPPARETSSIALTDSNFAGLPRCGLGHEGCLEAWVNSAKSIDELGEYLGIGLANIVDIFNPEKIIIGGGKLALGDFLPKAVEVMKEKGMKPATGEVVVEYAKLGEWSGVVGAAKLAME